MKHLARRTALILFLLLLAIPPPRAIAVRDEAEPGRRVRVGWYNSNHFQEGGGTVQKSGYSYEYLQSVSNYTGWEYEYVDGGWSDLYDALIRGDIDLLAGLSYTEERALLVNYPSYEMGFESYYIYKKAGNDAIIGSDLSTLDGKRVGTLRNNLMTACFEEWMETSGAACQEVMFDDFETRDRAFADGEIDALIAVNNNIPANSGMLPVVSVGASSYYLAAARDRTDLLNALNRALTAVSESNPYFIQSLQIKYFQNTAVTALSLEEAAWTSTHASLRLGCLRDYIPYCGVEESGEITGVVTDIFGKWREQLGLADQMEIEYMPYTLYTDMIAALQAGEIDAAFPVYDNIWISEQQGIVQTHDLVESSIHLVFRGEYGGQTTRVIAVSDCSPFQRNYVATRYPDSQVYAVDTPEACLEAVKEGRADCTFLGSGRAESLLSRREYQSLNHLTLEENADYCIGVRKGSNAMYSLLARGISLIDKSDMTNAMYGYMDTHIEYTLSDFVQDHVGIVLFVAALMLALTAAVALMLASNLRKTREQQAKELEMLRLVTLQRENLAAARDRLQDALKQYEKLSLHVVETLAEAIDAKDNYTSGHSSRVAGYAREIAKRAGCSRKEQDEIYMMGLLHDVGKIGIPDSVINKPGSLTDDEYHQIQDHPVMGARILRAIQEMPQLIIGARWHHERYDGTGYPDRLAGAEIPEQARIIAVADAYDAMSSNRSYREELPQGEIRIRLAKGRGTQFDPRFTDIMLDMIESDTEYKMREECGSRGKGFPLSTARNVDSAQVFVDSAQVFVDSAQVFVDSAQKP